jgi:two-component system alkaline phosphatase synthesis response regulator PhoP
VLSVSVPQHCVTVGDESVSLTQKEFEMLCLLLENRGTVLSRDRILREVWGYEFDGENRTVDVHIRTLRAKLGEEGGLVETVRGYGYRIS